MANSTVTNEKIKYSKLLSALFCSTSIIMLSILCLLNNLSLDLYSALILLRTVVPGSFCFWFLGYAMGSILDKHSNKNVINVSKLSESDEAYAIPSMFTSDTEQSTDDGLGEI